MDFSGLEAQLSELGNQVIQMTERFDLLAATNQEKAAPDILLEKNNPLLGVSRVCNYMGVKNNAFGMIAFHSITVHVSHHATCAFE